jgi:hypothetical protein
MGSISQFLKIHSEYISFRQFIMYVKCVINPIVQYHLLLLSISYVIVSRQRQAPKPKRSYSQKRSYVDCGTKECTLEHIMKENCFLYIFKNNTGCEIPCKLEKCQKQLYHFIDCPVWSCRDYSTTTTTTTTTTLTTTTTDKTKTTTTSARPTTTNIPVPTTMIPLPIDHPTLVYSSLALNVLLVFVLVTVFYYKCKKCIVRRVRNFRNRNQRPHFAYGPHSDQSVRQRTRRVNRHFSVTSQNSENEPLLQNVNLNSPTDSSLLRMPLDQLLSDSPNPTSGQSNTERAVENDYFFMFKKKTVDPTTLNLDLKTFKPTGSTQGTAQSPKIAPSPPQRTTSKLTSRDDQAESYF